MVSQSATSSLDSLVSSLQQTLDNKAWKGKILLTTSFSHEDQLLTWAVMESGLSVEMVSLDTGLLFPATLQTWKETEAHFEVSIRSLVPDKSEVDSFNQERGLSSIYQDVGARKSCCSMRKIVPLKQACQGMEWWLTGLRKSHSENRAGMTAVEPAPEWGVQKFHPLLDWTDAQISAAVKWTGVPVNPLYKMGYSSIGCAPCTRPVLPGESPRAGRWWWEQSAKECGLHRG
jgi:phosphoadenosine phosphosulfate reductase